MKTVFRGVFGSHLYGLNTPESDNDYKGIFMPSLDAVILDGYKDTIETKGENQDSTWIALPKFYKMMQKCDTVSFDMLHTPINGAYTYISSPLWEKIRERRSDLYCKNMRGVIGYIKTQAAKYGHKVDRFNELVAFRDTLILEDENEKIANTVIMFDVKTGSYKYITHNEAKGVIVENIDVLGSRYQVTATIGYLLDNVQKKIDDYGERTIKSANKGGDWKSMSHSYRVLCQVEEMVETGNIMFPLTDRKLILNMKQGRVTRDEASALIDFKYDEVVDKLENSNLPEEPNLDNIRNIILEAYK